MEKAEIKQFIQEEFAAGKISDTSDMNRLTGKLYRFLPSEENKLIESFDCFVNEGEWKLFWMVTQWIKRKKLYNPDFMDYYEDWLYNHIDAWGKCDVSVCPGKSSGQD